MITGRSVVVGTDFSASSDVAVQYAAELASRRDAPLRLIHAHENPLIAYTGIGMAVPYMSGEDAVVDYIDVQLKQTAEALRHDYPGLHDIDARRIEGPPASVLIHASVGALATVVGCRGVGGFSELLLGSVSSQVATHAHGPVIVIRPPDHAARPHMAGPVLVGYDGSPASQAALEFAAAEAISRGTRLIVAHVYWAEPWQDAETTQTIRQAAQILTEQGVLAVSKRHPELAVYGRTILDPDAEHALTMATKEAALTVVGCRGRGGFAGVLLGSVSRSLTHHGYQPVAVIHPDDHR